MNQAETNNSNFLHEEKFGMTRMFNRLYCPKKLNRFDCPKKGWTWTLIDDPEDIDTGDSEVDPAENAAFFVLDVVEEKDQRVEKIVSTWKKN